MRAHSVLFVGGLLVLGLAATRTWSGMPDADAKASFDLKGRWAAESKACSDAMVFVEFDGRGVVGRAGDTTARFADTYRTGFTDGHLVVEMAGATPEGPEQWRFLVDGHDTMRLDNALLARSATPDGTPQLMRFTRCPTTT